MRSIKRLFAAAAVGVITGGALLQAPALAASGPSPYCTTVYNYFGRTGSIIEGKGTLSCSSYPYQVGEFELEVSIERSRWYGWEGVRTVSGTVKVGTISRIASYNCAGTGTHEFRLHVYASKSLQTPFHTHVYSSTWTFSC